MNKLEIKHPKKSIRTGAYSDGVLVDEWLFISGQGPLNLETGEIMRGSIEEEAKLTLSHVKQIVEAAGGSIDDIVKCTVYLNNINDFTRFDIAYAAFFLGIKPARTTVQSVLFEGIKIEVDAIARIKK